MKLRRRKATSLQMHEIRKSSVRELGDHRRWWWTANPQNFADPLMVGFEAHRFHPVHGRLFRMTKERLAELMLGEVPKVVWRR